jgi:hypothetical protein
MSAVERGWQTAKLHELTCLLPSPSPVEAVETQRVSAVNLHRVYLCPHSEHAHTMHIQHDAHLPFLQKASGFGGCMQKTVCHTLETIITLSLVEVLPESHLCQAIAAQEK